MTKSTTSKLKMQRKSYKKKQHTIHPYLECIHGEIALLQEEILSIEALKATRDLTDEEKSDISIKNACLERYQATMTKLTEQSMANKVHSYTSIATNVVNEIRQKETISFLQLMYLMRLGQLGLYDCIDQAPSLDIVASLCDQIIGAAVYYAKESSHQIKDQKRLKIQELLRKWDQASNDTIDDAVDGTTFKQLRDFLQHIWDNSKDVKNTSEIVHSNTEQPYAVLQFEGMIPKDTTTLEDTNVPEDNPEASVLHTFAETNAPDDTCSLSNHGAASDSIKTTESVKASGSVKTYESVKIEDVENKPPAANNTTTEPSSCDNVDETPKSKPWDHIEEVTSVTSGEGDKNGKSSDKENKDNKKAQWNKTKSESWEKTDISERNNWEDSSDKHGWRSIDNNIKGQGWNNADSQNSEKVIEDKFTSSLSPVVKYADSPENNPESNDSKPVADSNDNDWRHRDENSLGRGRGRGYRGGRGRGKFTDRGRGRGGPRGRGRGRGREVDEDYNRHYEPTPPQQE